MGLLTLWNHQAVSGLAAQRLNGTWVSVNPFPGGIVLGVGDMLQRWSNDILRVTTTTAESCLSFDLKWYQYVDKKCQPYTYLFTL